LSASARSDGPIRPSRVLDSPWLNLDDAARYASGDTLTERGHVRIGPRSLKRAVKAGRLRAARIGGRKQLLFRREWIDAWILDQTTPVTLHRRAG
jgi:hypothetical protein